MAPTNSKLTPEAEREMARLRDEIKQRVGDEAFQHWNTNIETLISKGARNGHSYRNFKDRLRRFVKNHMDIALLYDEFARVQATTVARQRYMVPRFPAVTEEARAKEQQQQQEEEEEEEPENGDGAGTATTPAPAEDDEAGLDELSEESEFENETNASQHEESPLEDTSPPPPTPPHQASTPAADNSEDEDEDEDGEPFTPPPISEVVVMLEARREQWRRFGAYFFGAGTLGEYNDPAPAALAAYERGEVTEEDFD